MLWRYLGRIASGSHTKDAEPEDTPQIDDRPCITVISDGVEMCCVLITFAVCGLL